MLEKLFFNSQSVGQGWIGLLSGATNGEALSIALDSTGNLFVVSTINDTQTHISKFTSTGTLVWQRVLSDTSISNIRGNGLTVDSSGNVYITGSIYTISTSKYAMFIAKYDNDGNLLWQKKLNGTTGVGEIGNAITLDNAGNVYIAGSTTNPTGHYSVLVAQYDSSGNLQWQNYVGSNNYYHTGLSIAIVNSIIRAVGITNIDNNTLNTYNKCLVVSYDTAGGVYSTPAYINNGTFLNSESYDVASQYSNLADRLYIVGMDKAPPGNLGSASIIKRQTGSTTPDFYKMLYSSSVETYAKSVTVGEQDRVYITGKGESGILIAKFNTSTVGSVLWQRQITASGAIGNAIAYGNDGVYVAGKYLDGNIFIAKLPIDGSGIGTYTIGSYTITYEYSNLTLYDSSFSSGNITLGSTGISLTDSTASMTDSAGSITSTVTQL